ncbi:MAG: hypothetical protein U0R52_12310 [Solirubrobacterales bacterium]
MRDRARATAARLLADTTRRKRAIALLAGAPPAAALVAGVAAGAAAGSAGWGWIAIAASVPIAAAGGWLAGGAVVRAARSVRRVQGGFWLVDKVEPLRIAVDEGLPRRVDIVHPAVDLKHFFGGFIAVFNLARRLGERGHRVRVIALEGPELPADWRDRLRGYEGIGSSIDALEVVFATDRGAPIGASPADAVVATHWTAAHVAAAALGPLRAGRFLYLVQEYEPFIFPMGSAAAMCRASYDLPHTALFSTELLRDWFAAHRIGVFASGREAGLEASATFDNAITPVGPRAAAELRREGPGRLLFYARPEEHAARNLFEIGVMALDRRLAEGGFDGWELLGVGTVEPRESELPLPASGRALRLLPRRAQEGYAELLRSCDVGMALMYTPHPSLVPIEMAAAGMPTVTSTFENKDAAALARISPNLIAAEPSVEGVRSALESAERASASHADRAAGSQVSWPTDWDTALADPVMAEVERLLGLGSGAPPTAPRRSSAPPG